MIFTQPIHEANDCHNPAGPGGGQFCSDGGIWKTPLADYVGPWPGLSENPTDEEWARYRVRRQREQAWERAARIAIALGEITPEAAGELAGSLSKLKPQTERGIWEPLPLTLYHVTTGLVGVLEHGLIPRSERAASRPVGLGGGDEDAISLTTDKAYATVIRNTLLELHDVAIGKTTVTDLIQQAEQGVGANRPYIDLVRKYIGGLYGEFDDWANGWEAHTQGLAILASKIPPGALPVGKGWMGRDEMVYHGYKVRMSPERRLETATGAFNAWLMARQDAGGPENPWFGFNDAVALAKIPRNQIGLIEVTTKPGSMGWFISKAEREWRTSTGKVFKSLRVIR